MPDASATRGKPNRATMPSSSVHQYSREEAKDDIPPLNMLVRYIERRVRKQTGPFNHSSFLKRAH